MRRLIDRLLSRWYVPRKHMERWQRMAFISAQQRREDYSRARCELANVRDTGKCVYAPVITTDYDKGPCS